MKNYNEIITLAKMFNNSIYWLEVLQKNFSLSNSEMGYVVNNLK